MEILKKTWKWIVLGAALLSGSLLTMSVSSKLPLEKCFSDHGIEWSAENRAAEAAKLGIWGWKDTSAEQDELASLLCSDGLGYTVVTDYQKALSAPMTAAQSFVPVTSMTLRDGQTLNMSTLGSVVFLTLEPGATNEEIVACTDLNTVTKQFTGCTRGLAFSGTSTAAVAANAKTHSSGSTVVMSNVHYVYQQFLDRNGSTQYVTSTVIFSTLPSATSTTSVPSSNAEFTTWYAAQTLIAGGFSSLNVSSTLGLQALNGLSNCSTSGTCVGIKISATSSGLTVTSTNWFGSLAVNASSTGGLFVGADGKLAVDTSDTFTWTGAQNFRGQTTVVSGAGQLYVPTPTDAAEATPKNYVDQNITLSTATGTAGMAITAGRALYASPTSSLLLTDTSANTSTFHFVGIAQESAASGASFKYSRPGATVCGLSGLTPGSNVYLNGTAGQISATPAAKFARIGLALSSTCVQLMSPKYSLSSSRSVSGTGSNFEATGFYPAKITLSAGPDGASASGGSVGSEAGFVSFRLLGASTYALAEATSTPAYRCYDANAVATECYGSVSSRNESGFYVNVGTASFAHTYIWTADSE